MTLIPNWRKAWRMLSVQFAAVAIGFGLMPPDAQAIMLDAIGVPQSRIPAVLGALVLVGRLMAQPKTEQ